MAKKSVTPTKTRTRCTVPPFVVPETTRPGYFDIATRAYELFIERGGAHGFDQEDWIRAERELQSTQA